MSAGMIIRLRCDELQCTRWISVNTGLVATARIEVAGAGWGTGPGGRNGLLDLCPSHAKVGKR